MEKLTNQEVIDRFNVCHSHGKHHWALCLKHDDHEPSLLITEHDDGSLQMACMVCGAGNKESLKAVGLRYYKKGIVAVKSFNKNNEKYKDYLDRVAKYKKSPNGKRKSKDSWLLQYPTERYTFLDESGKEAYFEQKYEKTVDGERHKTFRLLRKHKGGICWGITKGYYKRNDFYNSWSKVKRKGHQGELLEDIRFIPYNLPNIIKPESDTIFIVEGGKDAKNLNNLGLVATYVPFGGGYSEGGKWKDEYCQYFNDKNVVIVPDNDEAGIEYSEQIAESLKKHGKCKSIKLMEPISKEEKGDVSDWVENLSKNHNDINICEQFLDKVAKTSFFWTNKSMYQIHYESTEDREYLSDNKHFQSLDITKSCNIYAPTGSGKTHAILEKCNELSKDHTIVFSTPTIALADQLYNSYDKIDMQLVKGGVKVDKRYNFFITTDASLGKVVNNIDMSQAVLVNDEMHEAGMMEYKLKDLRKLYEYSKKFKSTINLTGTPIEELDGLFSHQTYSYSFTNKPKQDYKELMYNGNITKSIENNIVEGAVNVVLRNHKALNKNAVEELRAKGYKAISLHREHDNEKSAYWDEESSETMKSLTSKNQCFPEKYCGRTLIVFTTSILEAGLSIQSGKRGSKKHIKLGNFFILGHFAAQSVAQCVNRFRNLTPNTVFICKPKSRKEDYAKTYDMEASISKHFKYAAWIGTTLNQIAEFEFKDCNEYSLSDSKDVKRFCVGDSSKILKIHENKHFPCAIGISMEAFAERQQVALKNPLFRRKEMEGVGFKYCGEVEYLEKLTKDEKKLKDEVLSSNKEEVAQSREKELDSYETFDQVLEDQFLDREVPNQLYELIHDCNLPLRTSKGIIKSLNFSKQQLNTFKKRFKISKVIDDEINKEFTKKLYNLFPTGRKIIPQKILDKHDGRIQILEPKVFVDFEAKKRLISLFRSDEALRNVLYAYDNNIPYNNKTFLGLFFELQQDKCYAKDKDGNRIRVNCYKIVSKNPLGNYKNKEGFPELGVQNNG